MYVVVTMMLCATWCVNDIISMNIIVCVNVMLIIVTGALIVLQGEASVTDIGPLEMRRQEVN